MPHSTTLTPVANNGPTATTTVITATSTSLSSSRSSSSGVTTTAKVFNPTQAFPCPAATVASYYMCARPSLFRLLEPRTHSLCSLVDMQYCTGPYWRYAGDGLGSFVPQHQRRIHLHRARLLEYGMHSSFSLPFSYCGWRLDVGVDAIASRNATELTAGVVLQTAPEQLWNFVLQ